MKAPLVGGPWGLDRSKPEKGGSLGGWGGIRCTEAARPATTPWRVGTAALRNTLNPKPKTQNPKPKTQNRRRPVQLNATASRSACFAKQIELATPDASLLAIGHSVIMD